MSVALAAATSLSGCLRGSTADPAAVAAALFEARSTANSILIDATTLPTTGSGTYSGYAAGMIKDTALDSTGGPQQIGRHWVGDATFDVAFSSNSATFDGSIANILAKDDVDQRDAYTLYATGTQEEIATYLETFDQTTGSIAIKNGKLSPQVFNANYVTSDVSGGFTHNGDDLQFSGTGRGYFFGAEGQGLNVNAETNDALTITENGVSREGDFGATTIRE